MNVFFFVVLLLIPLTMLGLGLRWKNNPPKEINNVSGYKTTWSMKSRDTWIFAHKYYGRISIYIGLILGIISLIILLFYRNYDKDTLGMIVLGITLVQIIGLFSPIIPTERALKRNFDMTGNRK